LSSEVWRLAWAVLRLHEGRYASPSGGQWPWDVLLPSDVYSAPSSSGVTGRHLTSACTSRSAAVRCLPPGTTARVRVGIFYRAAPRR